MTTLSRSFLVAALALSAGSVVSAQQAPARTPPPPTPRRDTVPALPPPARPAPPPRGAAAPARAAAAQPAPTAALRPASRPSRVPPESSLTRVARADTAPTGATGRCRDGTWLTGAATASACAAHRGLAFARQPTAGPPRPTRAAAAPVAAAPAMQANLVAAPPSGATMRCKNGEWLSGTPSADRCAGRGGVALILPAGRQAPPTPRQQH